MRFELMHRTIPVCTVDMDEFDGDILKVTNIVRPEHMPLATVGFEPQIRSRLNKWWSSRAIPDRREGLDDAMESMGISVPQLLPVKSLGLSLSDQYWMRPSGSTMQWSDVNFFDNPFSEDVGDLLFGCDVYTGEMDLSSPDNTSDGVLRKRWKILDGRRCLLKTGTDSYQQEPYNEVIASKVMESMDIPHVDYALMTEHGRVCSVCPDFVDRDTELITASRIFETKPKDNRDSGYEHLVGCCQDLGVDIIPFLDRMLVVDFVLANDDRHLNNFGLLRRAESLEWIGPAPIYDTGSCLGCRMGADDIRDDTRFESKPFRKNPYRQLELVTDLGWVRQDALDRIPDIVVDVLSPNDRACKDGRLEAILDLVEKRVEFVKTML